MVAPREHDGTRRGVLIAGSGRSGTSLMAGVLGTLALHIPQPEVAADQTNLTGFGEPRWVVDFHRTLLDRAMVRTSDSRPQAWFETARLGMRDGPRRRLAAWLGKQFGEADELLVKDPRLIWFLDLWVSALESCSARPAVLTMLRPPSEVVSSKAAAYGGRAGQVSQVAGWVNVMLHGERATRGLPRCYVRYDDLLEDWPRAVDRVSRELDLPSVREVGAGRVRAVHRLVDPTLRHQAVSLDDLALPGPVRDLAAATWTELSALAEPGGDTQGRRAALDELRTTFVQTYQDAEALAWSSAVAQAAVATRRLNRDKPARAHDRAVRPAHHLSVTGAPRRIAGRARRWARQRFV